MQSISKEIKFKKRESFIIKPVGDIHYGSKNCNTKKLEKLVDWIKNTPNVYWIGMGDMAEYINISDPRFDPKNIDKNLLGNLDNLALYQADYLAELFRPISSRCIGLLDGNHEETMRLKSHIDVNACISDKAKLPRLGYNAFINLRFIGNGHGGRRAVTIFATHGVGGAGQVGGKINRLLNLSKDFDADVYLFAHVHEKMVYSKEQLGVSQTGLNTIKKKKVYCLTGTFLETYSDGITSYGEKKLYPLGGIGTVSVKIKPWRSEYMHITGSDKLISKELPPDIHASDGDIDVMGEHNGH